MRKTTQVHDTRAVLPPLYSQKTQQQVTPSGNECRSWLQRKRPAPTVDVDAGRLKCSPGTDGLLSVLSND